MKRGEIWLVALDPTHRHQQKGWRPVLIVSPEAFNRVSKVPVVVPITSGGNFARTAGFAVPSITPKSKRQVWSAATSPGRSTLSRVAARGWKPFAM